MLQKLSLIFAFVLLSGSSPAQAFVVFQDPSDSGVNPGAPATVATDGTQMTLHLYVQHGSTLSDPNRACSGNPSPGADEFCGWDLRLQATGAMSLISFTPESVPPAPDSVVSGLTPGVQGELRANGGEPIAGQILSWPWGDLIVSATGPGTVEVMGTDSSFVTGQLTLGAVPSSVVALAGSDCASFGGDTDGDLICDDGPGDFCTGGASTSCKDNCKFIPNPNQEDAGGVSSGPPDGVGDACQCGDVTGDGLVNGTDSTFITRNSLDLFAPLFNVPGNCDVTGDGFCNGTDATFVTREALGLFAPLFGNDCPNFTNSCVADDDGNCP
jgi:hypothetical protein